MIDFEKFGYVPQNNKPEEEEVVEQPALFEEEPAEEAEEPAPQAEEVKAPAQEEPEEYYPPVSQKKPGQANIVVVGVGGGVGEHDAASGRIEFVVRALSDGSYRQRVGVQRNRRPDKRAHHGFSG